MPATVEFVYQSEPWSRPAIGRPVPGAWKLLPAWAQYYIELGKAIFEIKESLGDEESSPQLKIALVVPTRTYCCAFIALGLIERELGNLRLAGGGFERLINLGLRTAVWFQYRKKRFAGVIAGFNEERNLVGVLKNRGGTTIWLRPDRIEVREEKGKIALAKDPGGYRLPKEQVFFSEFLKDLGLKEGGLESRSFYLIKGLRDLQQEFDDLKLGLRAIGSDEDGEVISGSAQNLLRVRQLIRAREGISLGSHFSTGRRSTLDVEDEKQNVVLCDGGQALMHKSSGLKSAVFVSILDRSDSYFNRAVAELNADFGYRDLSQEIPEAVLGQLPERPAGVEIMSFWRQP